MKEGETLSQIAHRYKIPVNELASANRIRDPDRIDSDIVLFIPGAKKVRSASASEADPLADQFSKAAKKSSMKEVKPKPVHELEAARGSAGAEIQEENLAETVKIERLDTPEKASSRIGETHSPSENALSAEKKENKLPPPVSASTGVAEPKEKSLPARTGKLEFIWPLKGNISTQFGRQADGTVSNGITIVSKKNNIVKASEDGKVIHSDAIKYYGNTVMIKHRKDYMSIYANLKSRKVKTGDMVLRGDSIATANLDEKTGSHFLYFEIRYKNGPKNPIRYFP
ncbi:MAG: peptidoglycan DD-metalloendopeptidase family protein [Syntrophales bacterium]|jgi:septal ring factor EnvC (AmiA/AmiB activator)|nr:peptidoglycan DD-metalloendopeptidase family protein [Syntrophales bacterium]MDY0045293.1 peptidoglycan DD-metalloendopeptidase family protein [Syntrophales bacterium]